VRFHDQLLFVDQLASPFELSDIHRHVPLYERTDEDGNRLSECTLPIGQLRDFLAAG
jgi:hypothetical protein